jgi:ankyrin repeat protein
MFKVRVFKFLGFAANMLTAVGDSGTALHAALDEGNLELITLLLERGADPNVEGARCEIPRICNRHVDCRRQ